MTTKLDEMWAALEAHKPAPEYAEAWATMLKERTWAAMAKAYYAAPVGSAAKVAAEAAAWASWAADAARRASWEADAAEEAAGAAAAADRYAQEAIDAIREVKP